MKWSTFLERFNDCAVIEPAMVYAGEANPGALQAQLSRWVKVGRLIKLARGKYVLAAPYRKLDLPLEHVANRLVYPSYVSIESALAWYDLIPEAVAVVTSITTGRPRVLENALGTFRYRHIRRDLFWGFASETLQGQECIVALPEKAILDLFYERWHLSAPSREGGDEKCLLLEAAQFVVQWRYGNKERQSLCVRHEVSPGMGTEVSEVGTAGRDQRAS